MTFTATAKTLKEKIKAYKVLFGKEPKIMIMDRSFVDIDDETVFGPCEIKSLRVHHLVYEADGNFWPARIDAINEFKLY